MKLRASCRSTTRMRLVGSTAFVLLAAAAPRRRPNRRSGTCREHRRARVGDRASSARSTSTVVPGEPATARQAKTVYKSALHGEPVPAQYAPLAWTVEAEIAREGAPIDPAGKPFPVIVFSHGNTNDPIDYAPTLERIAAGGFVVAAPSHTNNTQDDTRIDFFNTLAGVTPDPCNDGPARPVLAHQHPVQHGGPRARRLGRAERAPGWFGTRVDTARAGVLGHSRGTLTALAVAGGSAAAACRRADVGRDPVRCWPLAARPPRPSRDGHGDRPAADLARRQLPGDPVPTLLVSGELRSDVPAVGQRARVRRDIAEHRRQAPRVDHERGPPQLRLDLLRPDAGGRHDRPGQPEGALLDKHTFDRIVTQPELGVGHRLLLVLELRRHRAAQR